METTTYMMHTCESHFNIQHLISTYNTQFEADYRVKGEIHNFWEMIYIQEGSVGITAQEQVFELKKGQVIFHKPGEFHNLWVTNGTRPKVFILTFTVDKCLHMLEDKMGKLSDTADRIINNLIQACEYLTTDLNVYESRRVLRIKEKAEAPCGTTQTVKNYLELLIIQIIRDNNLKVTKTSKLPITEENYTLVLSYINGNLLNELSVKTICRDCNISESTLKSVFKKYTGMGTMEYVNKMRIQMAITLLEQGERSKDIAEQLRFSTPYYFSKVFKKIVGSSPSIYKKRYLASKVRNVQGVDE